MSSKIRTSMEIASSGSYFRDQGTESSTDADTRCEISSSCGSSEDMELESMTGKGIKHLCSELLELKKASDEDFGRNVCSNYSAFVRVVEEVGSLENELLELKLHVSTQRKFVQDLMNGIYLDVISTDSIVSVIREYEDPEQHPVSKLEAHTISISEKLDVLLSEHRVEEALVILETDYETLQNIYLEKDLPVQALISYDSAISDKRTRLAEQLVQVAKHPRVSASEFQKALSGLCRLNEHHQAQILLLNFYHLRLANGIGDLHHAKPFMYQTYITKLAKFIFSVISQAARSFLALHGETSPYTSELIQWAQEETEVFVSYFDKYVKSISETTDGLSLAVEAVKDSISFCMLLQAQRIFLCPYLIKLLRPSMEQVLGMHIDHFKKVIGIFAANDIWTPSTFLVSRILGDSHTHTPTETAENFEYCSLTRSGRKFVTLVQAIIECASPLVILQMENSILEGLSDLFNEYIDILERAIPVNGNAAEKSGLRTNTAKTMSQQLALLANTSFLVTHLFLSIARKIFTGTDNSEDVLLAEDSQSRKLAEFMSPIQEAAGRLTGVFCQQFVFRVVSLGEGGSTINLATYVDGQSEPRNLVPSNAFQGLFLELVQLEQLAKDVFAGVEGVVEELLKQVIETFITWFSNYEEFWPCIDESSTTITYRGFDQFVLDLQFLIEISRFGGYFSDDLMDAMLALIEHMATTFLADGLDPASGVLDDEWAVHSAKSTIVKLLETMETEVPGSSGRKVDLEEISDKDHFENRAVTEITELEEIVKIELPVLQNSETALEEQGRDVNNSTEDGADWSFPNNTGNTGFEKPELPSVEGADVFEQDLHKHLSKDGKNHIVGSDNEDNSDRNLVKSEDGSMREKLEEIDEELENNFILEKYSGKNQRGEYGSFSEEIADESMIDNPVKSEDGFAGNASKGVVEMLQGIDKAELQYSGKDSNEDRSGDSDASVEENSDTSSTNSEKLGLHETGRTKIPALEGSGFTCEEFSNSQRGEERNSIEESTDTSFFDLECENEHYEDAHEEELREDEEEHVDIEEKHNEIVRLDLMQIPCLNINDIDDLDPY